jgi:GMP synthase-like glutamine amidotransferase
MTKIAIIDNCMDITVYNPVRHWMSYLDVDCEAFRAKEYQFPDLNEGFTHLILTGSEASILEREKWVYDEVEVVFEAVEKGIPILGSCYGHQLMALALAGPDHVRRCDQPEVGWPPITIEQDNTLLGEKGEVFSFSSHFDEVINLGKNFNILATSDHCAIQAFQLNNQPVWGLQFHPEMNIEEGQHYLKNRLAQGSEPFSLFKNALDSVPRDTGLINRIVDNFISEV